MRSLLFSCRDRGAAMFLTAMTSAALCVAPLGCDSKSADEQAVNPVVANWLDSWDDAVAESKKTGKPILIDFTGKEETGEYWCPPCREMRIRIFDTEDFKKWSDENVVLYEAIAPKKSATKPEVRRLIGEHRITGFPTVLIVQPDGTPVVRAQYAGETAAQWVGKVDRFVQLAKPVDSRQSAKENPK